MPTAHPRIAERAREPRYSFAEAGRLLSRQAGTLRRWAVGHDRTYRGRPVHDDPLIRIDGTLSGEDPPLSFLNLIELRFLASWRTTMPLQEIRQALAFSAEKLNAERPLLELEFKRHGRELFIEYERDLMSVNREGQIAWPEAAVQLFDAVEYDETEHAVFRWWPLGKQRPVVLDTRVNAGRPTTAKTGVRTIALATRLRDGWTLDEVMEDTTAARDEVLAAAAVEGIRLAA